MGKTSNPVKLLITSPAMTSWPELVPILAKLVEQGHIIDVNPELEKYDYVVGPNCWYVVPEVAQLFEMALKQARKVAAARKVVKPKVAKKPGKKKAKLEPAQSALSEAFAL